MKSIFTLFMQVKILEIFLFYIFSLKKVYLKDIDFMFLMENKDDQETIFYEAIQKILLNQGNINIKNVHIISYSFNKRSELFFYYKKIIVKQDWEPIMLKNEISDCFLEITKKKVLDIMQIIATNINKIACIWLLNSEFYTNISTHYFNKIEEIFRPFHNIYFYIKNKKLKIYIIITSKKEVPKVKTIQINTIGNLFRIFISSFTKISSWFTYNNILSTDFMYNFLVGDINQYFLVELLDNILCNKIEDLSDNDENNNIDTYYNVFKDYFRNIKKIEHIVLKSHFLYLILQTNKILAKEKFLSDDSIYTCYNSSETKLYYPFRNKFEIFRGKILDLLKSVGIYYKKVVMCETYKILQISRFLDKETVESVEEFLYINFVKIKKIRCAQINNVELEEIFVKIPSLFTEDFIYSKRTSLIFASICISSKSALCDLAIKYMENNRGKWINFDVFVNRQIEFVTQILKIEKIALTNEEKKLMQALFLIQKLREYKSEKIGIKIECLSNTQNIMNCNSKCRVMWWKIYGRIKIRDFLDEDGDIDYFYTCVKCNKNFVKTNNTNILEEERCDICEKILLSIFAICNNCNVKFLDVHSLENTVQEFCCYQRFNEHITCQNYEMTYSDFFRCNNISFYDINLENSFNYFKIKKSNFCKDASEFNLFKENILNFDTRINNTEKFIIDDVKYKIINLKFVKMRIYQVLMKFSIKANFCDICKNTKNDYFKVCDNINPDCPFTVCKYCLVRLWHFYNLEDIELLCPCCKRLIIEKN